jgi:MerR HTH family regulatory protein
MVFSTTPGPPCYGTGALVHCEVRLETGVPGADEKFDDEDYPAYTMGRAAEMLGVSPAFLRSLDEAKLFTPQRSAGGHRRYSRYQLRLAARVRQLVDQGTALEAACRIIILEDQLEEALRLNAEMRRSS